MKYGQGIATKPKLVETPGMKGRAVATPKTKKVAKLSCQEARLWNKGILLVRIIWMTKDWLHKLSMNQPVWKSAMKRALSQVSLPQFPPENKGQMMKNIVA